MEPKTEWFEEWFNTPYYYELYLNRDESEAKSFINKLIDYLKPAPGARILDIACGKGRHASQLAEAGFDVTGIDISPDSIEEAKAMEATNLHFYIHDMRLPFLINYFDCAFNFFTSFGYFRTKREHLAAIRTIAQSLKPGGIFMLDYLNAPYAKEHLVAVEEKTIGSSHYDITRWVDAGHFYKKIIVTSPDLQQPMHYTERVAAFQLADFREMFEKHGLKISETFGDYHFNTWDADQSPRLILIAEKPSL